MRTVKFFSLILILSLASCTGREAVDLLQYVDTRVGTAPSVTPGASLFGRHTENFGQTLPAVLEPNGMNFWTAQTRDTEQKCIAPYYYNDGKIQGFRNSHWIVGGCTQDYGSMTLMPLSGSELKVQPEDRASAFSHEDETATAAYYSVDLKDYGIRAEMTGRSRSAIFRFTYPSDEDAWLVVNPNSDEGLGYIEVDIERRQIRGYNPVHRIYQGWGEAAGYSGHFIIQLENEIEAYGTFDADGVYGGNASKSGGKAIGAFVKLKLDGEKPVIVKAASSFTDIEGAEKNLHAEIPHWDFDRTRKELTEIWEDRLSQITVKSDNETDMRKFYGALYRSSFLPRTFNDVDGRYPAFATGTPVMQTRDGRDYYDDYSMWDTYRALHPLINILSPEKAGDMMQSIVDKYEQGGWLPIFPCWNSYTAAMIGDHCISVLSDAYMKGIRNFDIEKAYEGMRKNAFETPADIEDYRNGMGRRALDSYMKYGYIPIQDGVPDAFHKREQASRTLEYAYDDFALALLAKELGHEEDAAVLFERAGNYRNVINPSTGYADGRNDDGSFRGENPFKFSKVITEGAPCHYTWYVPHDVYGLMECMGGKDEYAAKLDSMFVQQRYWHGNEPCHQVAYMFNYAGQPWKTQQAVRYVMDTEYLDEPGGLSGNEDAGQMSAWYVFSAMGFYPVCPGTPYYIIGSPVFPETVIRLENGKRFSIIAHGADNENIYIQSAKLNGKKYDRNYLSHEDIMKGGKLEFIMGIQPNPDWGSSEACLPPAAM